MARIIAVASQKGGVGKTTTVLHLSCAISQKQGRVLAVDLDPQGSLSEALGFDVSSEDPTLFELMVDSQPGHDTGAAIVGTQIPGVDLLPATIDLATAEEILLSRIGRERILKQVLAPVLDEYSTILIDCPPSLGQLVINGLTAADLVLIPFEPEILAYRALRWILDTVERIQQVTNPGLKVGGIVVTKYRYRTVHARAILDKVRHEFPGWVIEPPVRELAEIRDAASGDLVCRYDKASTPSEPYQLIAAEVINHA